MSAAEGFRRYADRCPNRTTMTLERRPVNGLNIEIGQGCDRCKARTPDHWPAHMGALRWLASGGSALVFGACEASACPLKPNHCACGHRADNHEPTRGCIVFGCACVVGGRA